LIRGFLTNSCDFSEIDVATIRKSEEDIAPASAVGCNQPSDKIANSPAITFTSKEALCWQFYPIAANDARWRGSRIRWR
jgi:hypothetical protein